MQLKYYYTQKGVFSLLVKLFSVIYGKLNRKTLMNESVTIIIDKPKRKNHEQNTIFVPI